MYQPLIDRYLTGKGYQKREDDRYHIDISTVPLPDWDNVLYNDLYPMPAFKQAWETFAEDYASFLAIAIKKTFKEAIPHDLQPIETLLREKTVISYSLDTALKQPVRLNICIDTGDSCSEFFDNTVFPSYDAEYPLGKEGSPSILWLTKQQGHKKGELHHALKHIVKHPERIENPFIKSLAQEVRHQMCSCNPLVFFLPATVYDVLVLNSLMRWAHDTKKWGGYIVLSSDTTAGFYAPFPGTTSLLGIALEKPVKIPVKLIYYLQPDGGSPSDYSAHEIWESSHPWNRGRIMYRCLPKHFRLSMASMGLEPVLKNS